MTVGNGHSAEPSIDGVKVLLNAAERVSDLDQKHNPGNVSEHLRDAAASVVTLQQNAEKPNGEGTPDAVLAPRAVLRKMHEVIADEERKLEAAEPVERDEIGPKKYGAAVRLDTLPKPKEPRRVSWGVPELDEITGGGLAHRRLTLVVLDTGLGKTRLTLRAAVTTARAGYKVVILNTELTPEDVRMMLEVAECADAIGSIFVIDGDEIDANQLEEFEKSLSAAVEDTSEGKVLGIIDLLQDVDPPPHPEGRNDLGIEAVAKRAAKLAKTLDVPLILTSQTSREAIKRGMDVHAAAGGNAERKASTVIVGKALTSEEGEVHLKVCKLRWGRAGGKVDLAIDYEKLLFTASAPVDLSGIVQAPKKPRKSDLIVEFVIKYTLENRQGPTKHDIAKEFNLEPDTVYKKCKGLIERDLLDIIPPKEGETNVPPRYVPRSGTYTQ